MHFQGAGNESVSRAWDCLADRRQASSIAGEATVECESEEGIADALSDTYGWVVSDFVAVEEFDISGADRSGEF